MAKKCDNKSVGVIIKDGEHFALIKRKNYPISYAFVAGHLDGDTFEDAARKESSEEVDITVKNLAKKLDGHFKNSCKRDGGDGHHWQVFEAVSWEGALQAGSDAKEAFWVTPDELSGFVEITLRHAQKKHIPIEELPKKTAEFVDDPEWEKNPGLEPVWVTMLYKIGIIDAHGNILTLSI